MDFANESLPPQFPGFFFNLQHLPHTVYILHFFDSIYECNFKKCLQQF